MAVRELFARERGLALGSGEVAAALQHDRAVHAADAGEDRERMPVGPAHRRFGPLGGAVVVAHVLAGADEAAVHLAGRVRTEPALDREQHRLVEVTHALGDVALVDEHAALRLQRLGLEVGRPQVAGERDHVGRERGRPVELTAAVRDLRFAQEQRTVGHALGVAFEAAASAAQPRARVGGPRGDRVVLPQPHRALSGLPVCAQLVEQAVRPFAGLDALVEPAEPPRRFREHVGAFGFERRRVHRRRGCRVARALPVVARERVASGGQRVVHVVTLTPAAAHAALTRCAPAARRCARVRAAAAAAGLNSRKVTPSSVQPVCPPGQ